jgi:hypothetical protein
MNERHLPDLRILPTSALVLHEETEGDRTGRLVDRLARERRLKNPPIVAGMPDSERFVVLDGANRTTSLRAMGAPHVLVQVVNYDEVALDTWNHVVTGMDEEGFFAGVRAVEGLALTRGTLPQARSLLTARRCLGYLICSEGKVYLMRGGTTLVEEARVLKQVVRAYKGVGKIHRIKTDNPAEQGMYYDEPITAVMVFPRFTPADIINLATMDEKMPTGITRHIIPLRALRVNFDIDVLLDREMTLEQKEAALTDWMHERLQAGGVRVYQESTVLFDE